MDKRPSQKEWKILADAYEDTPESPQYAERAYQNLILETISAYEAYTFKGMQFRPWTEAGQPYQTSQEMFECIELGHLYYFQGGDLPKYHPLTQQSCFYNRTYNELFRCVHDMHHYEAQASFSPLGELKAFQYSHSYYSIKALPALVAETVAQTAWVNYGRHLRRPDGSLPCKHDADWVPYHARPYAPQKLLVLPWEAIAPFLG